MNGTVNSANKTQSLVELNAGAQPPADRRDTIVINVPGTDPAHANRGWSDAAAAIGIAWAWPVALLVVLFIFRQPITRFIDRLRSFKGAGMEATTEALINEELPTREPPAGASKIDPDTSPLETIVLAWVRLEKAAREAVVRAKLRSAFGPGRAAYSTIIRNVEALDREGLVIPEVRPLVVDLAKIRNQAIHLPEEPISHEALNKFYANTEFVIEQLNKVASQVD